MSAQDRAVTLKEWAKIAISKHSRKMLKYEAGVIKDKDPEDLHQMRAELAALFTKTRLKILIGNR